MNDRLEFNISGSITIIGDFVREFNEEQFYVPVEMQEEIKEGILEWLSDGDEFDIDDLMSLINDLMDNYYLQDILGVNKELLDFDELITESSLEYSTDYDCIEEIYEILEIDL